MSNNYNDDSEWVGCTRCSGDTHVIGYMVEHDKLHPEGDPPERVVLGCKDCSAITLGPYIVKPFTEI
jgi:hypothetical protein